MVLFSGRLVVQVVKIISGLHVRVSELERRLLVIFLTTWSLSEVFTDDVGDVVIGIAE